MKLNNKRTILVGLAFMSICTFWQMYDSVIPLILTKTFKLNETFSGLRCSFCLFLVLSQTALIRASESVCLS